MNHLRLLTVLLIAGSLSSCTMDSSSDYNTYQTYNYDDVQYTSQPYDYSTDSGYQYQSGRQVTVPDSYYAGASHSPRSHKDIDRNWVSNQNPQGYTIEIAEGDKAAQVAGKLFKAPKSDRRAQIKSYRNGSTYYKGVYGSYNSYEEAQKAFNALPQDIKQGAGIKNWSSVQSNMGD